MKSCMKMMGALLLLAVCAGTVAGNMVPNGSFEDRAKGAPWEISGKKIRIARGLGNNGTTGVLIPPNAGRISVKLSGEISPDKEL